MKKVWIIQRGRCYSNIPIVAVANNKKIATAIMKKVKNSANVVVSEKYSILKSIKDFEEKPWK